MYRPGARAKRTRGFLQPDIELLHCGHNCENDAWDGKVEIAEKEPIDRISENQFLAKQPIGKVADQALTSGEQDDHEADDDAGKGQRKGQHCDQHSAAGKAVALQEHPGDRRYDQRDDRGRRCEYDSVDQGGAVARLGQNSEIAGEP